MNGLDYQDFFVHPVEAAHRRYEALRAVFVEEQPMREVAQRYRLSYGTIRNWVSEFRRGRDAGQPPPFSPRQPAGVPRPTNSLTRTTILPSKSPMFRLYRWRPGGG
jgi:transposase-like protein